MFKKYLSLMFICLLAFAANLQLINAQTSASNNAATVDKIKAKLTDRTPSGLMRSDHAGVTASLKLKP